MSLSYCAPQGPTSDLVNLLAHIVNGVRDGHLGPILAWKVEGGQIEGVRIADTGSQVLSDLQARIRQDACETAETMNWQDLHLCTAPIHVKTIRQTAPSCKQALLHSTPYASGLKLQLQTI